MFLYNNVRVIFHTDGSSSRLIKNKLVHLRCCSRINHTRRDITSCQSAQQELIYNHLYSARRPPTASAPAGWESMQYAARAGAAGNLYGSLIQRLQWQATHARTGGELIFARFRRRPADCDNGEGGCVRALLFALAEWTPAV